MLKLAASVVSNTYFTPKDNEKTSVAFLLKGSPPHWDTDHWILSVLGTATYTYMQKSKRMHKMYKSKGGEKQHCATWQADSPTLFRKPQSFCATAETSRWNFTAKNGNDWGHTDTTRTLCFEESHFCHTHKQNQQHEICWCHIKRPDMVYWTDARATD